MSERIKYIISELNKPPFNKTYNLISFDSLGPDERIQMLTDILGEIDKKNKVDIHSEEPEETTIRLLTTLRILKYNPGPDPVGFRQGLVQGDKIIINPILEWLFKNMNDLKTRAYLAEFLVKIEIPIEIMADANIAGLYEKYEGLIEEFKQVHKECEMIKAQGKSTAELRADIETMEKEKEIVVKRTERLARKLESVENKDALLETVRKLRLEKERSKELFQQRQDEMSMMTELQQTIATLSQQLKDLRAANNATTPHGVVKQLEEEVRVNEYFVNERLPQEVEKRRREVEIMNRIALEPAPTDEDIALLQAKMEKISEEVNSAMQDTVGEERTGMERQQAAIAARKRDELADQYNAAKAKLDELTRQIEERSEDGQDVISEEEFKEYVAKLKVRSTLYKAKKSQIANLIAESGVLARTLDILNQQAESFANLESLEEKDKTNVNVEELSKEELQRLINEVNSKIATQKAAISPLMEELRETRQKYNEILEEYNEKKRVYDAAAAAADSSLSKLKQEVNQLRKDFNKADSEAALLTAKSDIAETMLQRAQDELVRYTEKGSTNSIRERLTRRIADQERMNRELKEEQEKVRSGQERLAAQTALWRSLNELMECKQNCMNQQKEKDGIVKREEGAETLVLQ